MKRVLFEVHAIDESNYEASPIDLKVEFRRLSVLTSTARLHYCLIAGHLL